MSIDFHDSKNNSTYAKREAEKKWFQIISEHVEIDGKAILDLGCGGGIYTKVFALSGARSVTAMDFSTEMLKGAKENCKELTNVMFMHGSALETNLVEKQFDILLERALIHHIDNLRKCFEEANRVLKQKGKFIIQDRTPEDCALEGSETHIRGYFFEKYPMLLEKEIKRRYSSEQVLTTLEQAGFKLIREMKYWETRKIHDDFEQLKIDIMNRTGRSLLHEITDKELEKLVTFIGSKIENSKPIKEEDRWTIWIAEKE